MIAGKLFWNRSQEPEVRSQKKRLQTHGLRPVRLNSTASVYQVVRSQESGVRRKPAKVSDRSLTTDKLTGGTNPPLHEGDCRMPEFFILASDSWLLTSTCRPEGRRYVC